MEAANTTLEETPAGKTAAELRVERMTWFGLVGVMILAGVLENWLALHVALVPLGAGLTLIASGLVQLRRKWRVGFTTWLAGILLLLMAAYNIVARPDLDLSLVVILLSALVIAIGVFRNET